MHPMQFLLGITLLTNKHKETLNLEYELGLSSFFFFIIIIITEERSEWLGCFHLSSSTVQDFSFIFFDGFLLLIFKWVCSLLKELKKFSFFKLLCAYSISASN